MTTAADPTHDELTEGQKAAIAYREAMTILQGVDGVLKVAVAWLTDVDDTSLIAEVNRARSTVASVVHQISDRMKP